MASFLRKKVTLPKRTSIRDPKTSTSSAPSETHSSDVPPSLPPLILSTSFADPDPEPHAAALPPAASPPVVSLPESASKAVLDDVWDPWKVYIDAAPLLDTRLAQNIPPPAAPPARNASVDAPNTCNVRPSLVATAPSPRKISTRQDHDRPKCDVLDNHPLTQKQTSPPTSSLAHPSAGHPAVVRGQMVPASGFDFEESLSAAGVTSVVNQVRSYAPPIRHHTSPARPSQRTQMDIPRPSPSNVHRHHTAPQNAGSSSSLSSSSHHTDATRRTDRSHGTSTSTSSVSPAAEVIDIRPHKDRRLDPPANGPQFASRPLSSSSSSNPVHRSATNPSTPPTSYSDRTRTLARQTSLPGVSSTPRRNKASLAQTPMLFDMLRSGHPDVGSLRKGPLIFAAMPAPQQPPSKSPMTYRNTPVQNPYPYPAQHMPLDPSRHSRLTSSISSALRGNLELRSHNSPERPPLARKSSKSSLRVGVERPASTVSKGESGSELARPRVLTKTRPTTPREPGIVPDHKVLPQPGDPLLLDDDPFARNKGVKMLRPRDRSSSGASASLSSEEAPKPTGTPPPSIPDKLPPTPPDDYRKARQQRRGQWLEKVPPPAVAEAIAKHLAGDEAEEPPREPTPPPTYFPIMAFMSNADLLPLLLSYLSYSEWLSLYSANNQIRDLFHSRTFREFVLECYLGTVGYSKWNYEWAEPLALSLKDLHNYLRGVSMPAHAYARLSAAYLKHPTENQDAPATSDRPDILALALTTRAYTRVILRLRAQAESEAKYLNMLQSAEAIQTTIPSRPGTRQHSVSSRAPSPTPSHSHGKNERSPSTSSPRVSKFRSPLYRPGRAPVLRVFVPSPEGDWLSDASVVECEAELKRSNVLKLLRVGDVVWDVAVGDEGNLGRLMWDGSYLVDLDYRYSRMGELSPYFHSLAFAPSYFHRVIRIGGSASHNPHCNPIIYIDVSPWGREIAVNLQLLQDRARTETPHGALHDVVRWVHRSTFTIRPPSQGQIQSRSRTVRVAIPNVEGFHIDPGWYGKVVLESEGTNEGLADLQARCGPGVFPPRAESLATKMRSEKEKDNRRVWRILREKSRPGEIWLRTVQAKERMM